MDFAALDFETANHNWSSPCAVGVAIVRDGQISDSFSTLIRPEPLDFDERNVQIHGICARDVENAPSFPEVWEMIEGRTGPLPLVAHNAAFDIGVLTRCLDVSVKPPSAEEYACTCEAARYVLPGMPNHRLATLAGVFGIHLDHHDPASDALAFAELAILFDRMMDPPGLSSLLRPIQDFGRRAERHSGDWSDAVRLYLCDSHHASFEESENGDICLVVAAEADGRFENKKFVLTGELNFMPRADAEEVIRRQGGRVMSSVSRMTDYVIAGEDELARFERTGRSTTKLNKAKVLAAAGAKVHVLNEEEFIDMIE